MKKIILSAIIAACAITANAQTWIGGELLLLIKAVTLKKQFQMSQSLLKLAIT